MTLSTRIGGSFAPPLDADQLGVYATLAHSAPAQISEAMKRLIVMLYEFKKTPASTEPASPHPSGRGVIRYLSDDEKARMWDYIPWPEELDMYQHLFNELPTGTIPGPYREVKDIEGRTFLKQTSIVTDEKAKDLRDACFHLLWFARELDLDREPCTSDML